MELEYKITIDQKYKVVKIVWNGKWDPKVIDDGCREVFNEVRKFPKGEVLYLCDISNVNSKFITPEISKLINEWIAIVVPLVHKCALVVQSFILQKSWEHDMGTPDSNVRRYVTEQEAMKWLMEGKI